MGSSAECDDQDLLATLPLAGLQIGKAHVVVNRRIRTRRNAEKPLSLFFKHLLRAGDIELQEFGLG
jgi:hypothetical protein